MPCKNDTYAKSDTKKNKAQKNGKRDLYTAFLIVYDFLSAIGAYPAALWICFDCSLNAIPNTFLKSCIVFAPVYACISLFIYAKARLYRSLWQFASYVELGRVLVSSVISSALHAALITAFFMRMPAAYYLMGSTIQTSLILLIRFGYRFVTLERGKRARMHGFLTASRVMLIGAGTAGQLILRDIHSAKEVNECVLCIIDDNPNKWGRSIDGVPIVGGRDEILLNVQKYRIEKIYLAIPSATAQQKRDILDIMKETGCELKSLPGVFELVNGSVTTKSMKEVNDEDLLGREPVKVNMDEISSSVKGKTILVTGGGGSIGSELCRQIALHAPQKLIVFDIYENNAHSIGLELKDRHPELDLEILIGSVRDSRRLNQVFQKFKPDVVYHAAAHKHVPLMEFSPCESIKNNAFGTYKTAYAAMMNGCRRFVLISTDKAVNPMNIMGASKRLCEMIIQAFDKKIREGKAEEILPISAHDEYKNTIFKGFKPQTEFVAVRFGNVLSSNGSVIPRFKEQISKGGPVTVTHPDIIRYFMTISEAASLVLQAGAYAKGGEIFVLDMGEPVKIETLARNLIRLSGLRPDEDIKIAYTGLRPREKLYEEKLMREEGLKTTPNHLIHIGSPIPFDEDRFLKQLPVLMKAANDGREAEIRDLVSKVVKTYHPAQEN